MLLGLMAGGELAEHLPKLMNGLRKDGSFRTWWQRRADQSIVSVDNLLKAGAVIAGYSAWQHIDPLPESPIDNLAVLALSAYLLGLLAVPQSAELGATFPEFEGTVLIGLQILAPDKRDEVMRWVRELTPRQERRIVELFRGQKVEEVVEVLHDDEARAIVLETIGEDPRPPDGKELLEKLGRFLIGVPATYKAVDTRLAATIRKFREKHLEGKKKKKEGK